MVIYIKIVETQKEIKKNINASNKLSKNELIEFEEIWLKVDKNVKKRIKNNGISCLSSYLLILFMGKTPFFGAAVIR